MDLKINYPLKPYIITQHWGNLNPAYAAQFNDPNFKRHNGTDSFTGKYGWDGKVQTEYPVYCPVDGFIVESVSFEANGGGNQISLISKQKIQVFEQLCFVRLFLCHAKRILVHPGDEVKLGQLLMIADSTGFSTGLHTHLGMYRLNDNKQKIDTNEATGSFDPELFFTGKYAIDLADLPTLINNNLRYYQYLLLGN
jgi:murein DD-endopeptidase MepM/ murein hydrolase activator NlpD